MKTALITHPACLDHDTGPGHPERADRVGAVLRALDGDAFADLLREVAPQAAVEPLARAHSEEYVRSILAVCPAQGELAALDSDTMMSAGSAEAALRAAGGAVAAVDLVMDGQADAAFVAVRPPGHHAERSQAMGFCLFNNVAIAAHHARARWGLSRIAVADFDVHHGNGTQAMFADDPGLFFASSHQSPCYPGTGHAHEHGVANNIVNAPLLPGSGSTAFRQVWRNLLLPALDAFAPELLIVSAGFDAHRNDPLAQLQLETDDYAWVTGELISIARRHSSGHIVSLLEGGYDLDALGQSAAAHVRAYLAA
jgi:acetoin utilization deacetylase AcuC-like enzyme